MKKMNKVLLSAFTLIMLFSIISSSMVVAVGPPDLVIPVAGDTHTAPLEANVRTTFQFRARTNLTFQANVNMNLNLQCEAMRIGEKDFIIEIEAENDLEMNMTCTEEQAELGLLKGNTYQIRNRNRLRYQEGFCVSIECNGTCTQARLRIRATNQNRLGTFAYYDEGEGQWVSVPTTVEDGYLTAETDHFSTWTILIPDYTVLIIGISIGAVVAVVAIVLVIYFKRRK